MKKSALFLFCIFAFSSCLKTTDCFSPPPQVIFEIVNSASQNLIKSGDISEETLQLQEETSDGSFIYAGYTLTEDKLLIINNAGWEDGTRNYRFTSREVTFNLRITSSEIDSKQCGGRQIDEVKFLDINSKLDNGIYKVIPE